ncbi:hypothetical protein LCGC14_0771690 [marine sediment metagenome]|uniref:Uncharacterized protein n=1 Tax=marine sediment metagenome TaxID=412755 RepID=A0A0F9SI74_9ZZZZ
MIFFTEGKVMEIEQLTKTGRIVASGLITDRSCYVFAVCGIGVSAATNRFNLYDGFSMGDRLIMTLGGIQYQSDFRSFPTPLFFAKGVYIAFITNGTSFFVQYAEAGE